MPSLKQNLNEYILLRCSLVFLSTRLLVCTDELRHRLLVWQWFYWFTFKTFCFAVLLQYLYLWISYLSLLGFGEPPEYGDWGLLLILQNYPLSLNFCLLSIISSLLSNVHYLMEGPHLSSIPVPASWSLFHILHLFFCFSVFIALLSFSLIATIFR